MRPSRVPSSAASLHRVHHVDRLDHRLARAAVGWSIWADTEVDEVADRLLGLAAGNRTALERALRRFRQVDSPVVTGVVADENSTTAGRAAAALQLALTLGNWDR